MWGGPRRLGQHQPGGRGEVQPHLCRVTAATHNVLHGTLGKKNPPAIALWRNTTARVLPFRSTGTLRHASIPSNQGCRTKRHTHTFPPLQRGGCDPSLWASESDTGERGHY